MTENKGTYSRGPRSEITKRRISESLTGQKYGGNDILINPEDGRQLRAAVRHGDAFVHQGIIDWYRDVKHMR